MHECMTRPMTSAFHFRRSASLISFRGPGFKYPKADEDPAFPAISLSRLSHQDSFPISFPLARSALRSHLTMTSPAAPKSRKIVVLGSRSVGLSQDFQLI